MPSLADLPVVVYVMSDEDDPALLSVTGATASMLGLAAEDCVGLRPLHIGAIEAEDRLRMRASWQTARNSSEGIHRATFRVRREGPRTVWAQSEQTRLVDTSTGATLWHGVLTDISERIEREAALASAAEGYRSLVDHLPAITYRVAPDDDRRTLFVSPQVERSLGYSLEEWLDQQDIWTELLHPDDREPTLAAWDAANESGERFEHRYRLISSDGTPRWFQDVAVLIRDESGRPTYWEGVQMDVTEQQRMEEDLRAATFFLEERVREGSETLAEASAVLELEAAERRLAEARYERLLKGVPAWIYSWKITDGVASGGFTSPQSQTDFGFDLAEAERAGNGYWQSFVHPDDVDRVFASIQRSAREGIPFEETYRWITRTGRTFRILDRARPAWFDHATRCGEFVGVMVQMGEPDPIPEEG